MPTADHKADSSCHHNVVAQMYERLCELGAVANRGVRWLPAIHRAVQSHSTSYPDGHNFQACE